MDTGDVVGGTLVAGSWVEVNLAPWGFGCGVVFFDGRVVGHRPQILKGIFEVQCTSTLVL